MFFVVFLMLLNKFKVTTMEQNTISSSNIPPNEVFLLLLVSGAKE
jgi:hypothetical protein